MSPNRIQWASPAEIGFTLENPLARYESVTQSKICFTQQFVDFICVRGKLTDSLQCIRQQDRIPEGPTELFVRGNIDNCYSIGTQNSLELIERYPDTRPRGTRGARKMMKHLINHHCIECSIIERQIQDA